LLLKSVFDDYDRDGSGYISMPELKHELWKQKANAQRYDGHRMTLHERAAFAGRYDGQSQNEKGSFLLNFAETIFITLDTNEDGRVSFKELLCHLFPLATPAEVTTMVHWVTPEIDDEQAKKAAVLTAEQEHEARSIFDLYDVDGSGTISRREFRKAMRPSGMPRAYLGELFDSADQNANEELEFSEWRDLVREAGLYSSSPLLKQPFTPPRARPRVASSSPSTPASRQSTDNRSAWTCPPSPLGKAHTPSGLPKALRGSPSEHFLTRFQKAA